jgi:hypothetical protein
MRRAFDEMISIGRWVYDPTRGLSEDCRKPAASDEDLNKYRVSSSAPGRIISHDGDSKFRKRGQFEANREVFGVSDDDQRFVFITFMLFFE